MSELPILGKIMVLNELEASTENGDVIVARARSVFEPH